MNNCITRRQIADRLGENQLDYAILPLQNGLSILIAQPGARIFGPFLTPESESLNWVNGAFASAAEFQACLARGEWNLGGERLWIAPEVQFNVRNRADFWNTLHVPPAMDPGCYQIYRDSPHQLRMEQELDLPAYNLATGLKRLQIQSVVQPVDNPLRQLGTAAGLMEGVTYAGYQQQISVRERTHDTIPAEAWNLLALNPGGTLWIPVLPLVEYSDYFEPVDETHQRIEAGCVRLRISGQRRFKVGYKAAHVYGRAGYLNRMADGGGYLLVRHFTNNPSATYAEEPPHRPGCNGHSLHVYNDGGAFGGFGELECNGQGIGGATGRTASSDTFTLWVFAGAVDGLKVIAGHLLGQLPGAHFPFFLPE
jgi:hypothetical protein